jgi:hypothetical protein
VNLDDLISAHRGATETAQPADRRKRTRTGVHWTLVLLREGKAARIESMTQNLSSSGFYCLCPIAFTPGEQVRCELRVPTHGRRSDEAEMALECQAVVVRSEAAADGLFGIACRIEDYRLAGAEAVV